MQQNFYITLEHYIFTASYVQKVIIDRSSHDNSGIKYKVLIRDLIYVSVS